MLQSVMTNVNVMDKQLASLGATQVAIGAMSGWGLAALVGGVPGAAEKLGIIDVKRVRQAHVDVIIMGGLMMAASGIDGIPDWARRSVAVGAWTNPLLFLPMAFRKDAVTKRSYALASVASFTITCSGWVGIARAARRNR